MTSLQHVIDYKHSLLSARPNFAKALLDFETFLGATLDDLISKAKVLNDQRRHAKTRRDIRTYLTCQIYLLQKHLHRLNQFKAEIHTRVGMILSPSEAAAAEEQQTEISFGKTIDSNVADDNDKYLESNVNAILKAEASKRVKTSSAAKKSSILTSQQQPVLTQSQADDQFLRLLADMSKMKTRCKHILDVTDRYCVLDQDTDQDQTDHQARRSTSPSGKLSSDEDLADHSCDSSHSVESIQSGSTSSSPRIHGNVIKTTVTSVSSHLAVIAKTYTKRHAVNTSSLTR
jgi:hypothetical protein